MLTSCTEGKDELHKPNLEMMSSVRCAVVKASKGWNKKELCTDSSIRGGRLKMCWRYTGESVKAVGAQWAMWTCSYSTDCVYLFFLFQLCSDSLKSKTLKINTQQKHYKYVCWTAWDLLTRFVTDQPSALFLYLTRAFSWPFHVGSGFNCAFLLRSLRDTICLLSHCSLHIL